MEVATARGEGLVAAISDYQQRLEEHILGPMVTPGRAWYVAFGLLLIVFGWGFYAYTVQLRDGLVATGMRDRILWGLYITNFVFFIGISHAGALVSAVLRAGQAPWRTPMTRMVEFITVAALSVGALMPIIDLGRPDRIPNLFLHGRWQSPILWDLLAVSTYLIASIAYLYLPMIPDLAVARDRLEGRAGTLKMAIYRSAALGWRDSPRQRRLLNRILTIMMILIIPIAVSVHTVVSWIFAMTLREPWNSTVFSIFFVAGAIFSGIAVLILMMALLRRVYHLEEYLQEKHFVYLGYLMAVVAAIMIYFNIAESLVTGYKSNEEINFHFSQLFRGQFAGFFWFYFIFGLVIPILIALNPATRTIRGMVIAAAFVVVAMWVERYFIVVAALRIPLMPYDARDYIPSWVEFSVMAGAFALFGMMILLFLRTVPIMCMWEQVEQHELDEAHAAGEVAIGARPAAEATGGGA
jgi:molybdopterin-containing oxidoreductase family membrane subunit